MAHFILLHFAISLFVPPATKCERSLVTSVSSLQKLQHIRMAYRRIMPMGKILKPILCYKTWPTISRNPSSFLNLEGYKRVLPVSAMTQSHLFSHSSTISKGKTQYSSSNPTMVKNVSTLPQRKEKDLSGRIETFDGNNVEEDKALLEIAIDLHNVMLQIQEEQKKFQNLLEEIIAGLKGFISFIRWNVQEEKLQRFYDMLEDVDSTAARSLAAPHKLLEFG